MITSDRGRQIIMTFEGLRLKAYRCPAGILTIGYGHTRDPYTGKLDVSEGMEITQHKAETLLEFDLQKYEETVSGLAPICTGPQFSALVSFAFNLGPEALRRSTLLKRHNEGLFLSAANQFLAWDKATINGQKVSLLGLVKRRAAERGLYLEAES